MFRVSHLVQAPETIRHPLFGSRSDATDAAMLACRAAVEGTPDFEHSVGLIASSAGEFRADALGLTRTRRITAPLGLPHLASGPLRELLASEPLPDAVQCWNTSLVRLARRVAPAGVRVLGPPVHLPVPNVDVGARASLRALIDADDDTPVIGIVCDPPSAGDAHRLQYATGLFDICGLHVIGIVPGGASFTLRGRRFHRETFVRARTVFADYPAWSCLAACDGAFLHQGPRTHSPLARTLVLAAHAAGVPVVAAPGQDIRQCLEETRNADDDTGSGWDPIIASSDRPADLAKAMLVLLEQGLPAVRKLGEKLRAATDQSGEQRKRLASVRESWSLPSLV